MVMMTNILPADMSWVELLGKMLLIYLIGSIPSGLIIGKGLYGKDLREHGSKNIGSTNAYRVLGKMGALLVFLCDLTKGIMGAYLLSVTPTLTVIGGLLAMIGHNWPIFLNFKGGKGVATGLGMVIYMVPSVALLAFSIWAVIVYFTKYVSLGSIVAASVIPVVMYLWNEPMPYIVFGVIAALFVIIRHRANIARLLSGNELKVERTKE